MSVQRVTRGFTLIELLVVMLVLGVLAAAAMPVAELTLQRERERDLKQALREIREAIDAYKRASDTGQIVVPSNSNGYPASLELLVQGTADLRTGGQRLVFLRRIPPDPFAATGLTPVQGWRLRSYQSSYDKPEPGADVYDVSSRSTLVGLNGVPLKDW
jgi:general secretion pathway protein G